MLPGPPVRTGLCPHGTRGTPLAHPASALGTRKYGNPGWPQAGVGSSIMPVKLSGGVAGSAVGNSAAKRAIRPAGTSFLAY